MGASGPTTVQSLFQVTGSLSPYFLSWQAPTAEFRKLGTRNCDLRCTMIACASEKPYLWTVQTRRQEIICRFSTRQLEVKNTKISAAAV
jgi:hypothetical protein